MKFYAIYKNGEVIERLSIDMLPKSDNVFFYVKSNTIVSYKYGEHAEYCIINSAGETENVVLNGCSLVGFRTTGTGSNFYVELEFDILNKGLEKIRIKHELWDINEIRTVALIAHRINMCGYEMFLHFQKLEEENYQLKKQLNKYI